MNTLARTKRILEPLKRFKYVASNGMEKPYLKDCSSVLGDIIGVYENSNNEDDNVWIYMNGLAWLGLAW